MHVLFLQLARVVRILLSGEAHKPIVVHVDSQRIETRDEHVDPQIVLQTVE